ncbi:MAG: recombinase family protein, partial [Planctomycetota bacterium]
NGNTIGHEVIPKAPETIESIFEMRQDGIGKLATTQKLNETAEWTPPPRKDRKTGKLKEAKWRETYVNSILKDRAVIGERQLYKFDKNGKKVEVGSPIRGYYPSIIDEKIFFSVQKLLEQNKGKGKGGRRGKVKNLFTHIIHCGYCGGPEVLVNGGSKKCNPDYLVCSRNRLHKGCIRNSIRNDLVQDTILNYCINEIKPSEILPKSDKQKKLSLSLGKQLQAIETQEKDIERMIENQMHKSRDTKDPKMYKRYEKDIAELDEQLTQLGKHKKEVERKYRKAQLSTESIAKQQQEIADLREAIKQKNSAQLRMKLRMQLAELIEKVEIFGRGTKENQQVKFVRTPILSGFGKPVRLKKSLKTEYEEFAKYIVERTRGSKQDKFIRITFKSGTVVEIGPRGSIPFDLTFYLGKNGNIKGSYKWLWDEFKAVS